MTLSSVAFRHCLIFLRWRQRVAGRVRRGSGDHRADRVPRRSLQTAIDVRSPDIHRTSQYQHTRMLVVRSPRVFRPYAYNLHARVPPSLSQSPHQRKPLPRANHLSPTPPTPLPSGASWSTGRAIVAAHPVGARVLARAQNAPSCPPPVSARFHHCHPFEIRRD